MRGTGTYTVHVAASFGLEKNLENLVSVKGSVDEELEVQLVQSASKRQVPTWRLEYDIEFPCKNVDMTTKVYSSTVVCVHARRVLKPRRRREGTKRQRIEAMLT